MYNNNNNKNNNRNTSIVIMELINSLIVFIYHLQVPLNKKKNILSNKVYLFQQFNSNCETCVLNKFNAHRLK